MKVVRSVLLFLVVGNFLIFLFGCGNAGDSSKVNNTRTVAPVSYGNGVYYFAATKAAFGNSLSKFIATHPNLTLISIADDTTVSAYGSNAGYFVVFR